MIEKKLDLLNLIPYVRHADLVIKKENEYYLPWRIIYDYEMMFVLEGEIVVEQKDKKYVLSKNDIHIMKPNVWHTRYSLNNVACKYYDVHFELVERQYSNITDINVMNIYIDPILNNVNVCKIDEKLKDRVFYSIKNSELPDTFKVKDPLKYVNCFRELVEDFKGVDDFSRFKLRGMFGYLLGMILSDVNNNDADITIDDVIERFKMSFASYFPEDAHIKDFCKNYNYSYVYFRNKFKEKVGTSPKSFVQNKRLLMAINYLKSGYYNVSMVAQMLGYGSVYCFSAQFKKKTGKNPSEYLKKQGSDDDDD